MIRRRMYNRHSKIIKKNIKIFCEISKFNIKYSRKMFLYSHAVLLNVHTNKPKNNNNNDVVVLYFISSVNKHVRNYIYLYSQVILITDLIVMHDMKKRNTTPSTSLEKTLHTCTSTHNVIFTLISHY